MSALRPFTLAAVFGVRNFLQGRVRFLIAALGCAFACFLMIFQGSLLLGFTRASSRVVDSVDADLWITARGITCFDFGGPISTRYAQLVARAPEVTSTTQMCVAMANYKSHVGDIKSVMLVGSELPSKLPGANVSHFGPESLVVDESNAAMLQVTSLPAEAEINSRRAQVVSHATGFGSFLGAPYVFAWYGDSLKYTGMTPGYATFILANLAAGSNATVVRDRLAKSFPEVEVWTKAAFARQCQTFWLIQTGAGGAILTGAVLAFFIGLAVVSQTIYASTLEKLDEFATLKALGAEGRFLAVAVLAQALLCGLAGSLLGIPLAVFGVMAARRFIAWIYMPWSLPVIVVVPTVAMCVIAAYFAARRALNADPAVVFRA